MPLDGQDEQDSSTPAKLDKSNDTLFRNILTACGGDPKRAR
jgi:hypothetical protein